MLLSAVESPDRSMRVCGRRPLLCCGKQTVGTDGDAGAPDQFAVILKRIPSPAEDHPVFCAHIYHTAPSLDFFQWWNTMPERRLDFRCACGVECRVVVEAPTSGSGVEDFLRHCEKGRVQVLPGKAMVFLEKKDGQWRRILRW